MASQQSVSAVVSYAPPEFGKPIFRHETLTITKPEPGPNEALIRMIAVGICHTDIFVGGLPEEMSGPYPKVLGHEGAGYVEAVGSDVTSVQVGDPVLLSYTWCGKCDICTYDNVVYCERFNEENVSCEKKVWKNSEDKEAGGKFFGQSSFASLSIVDEKSIVNAKDLIKNEDELKLFAPLGCGLMTGSGALINAAAPAPTDVIMVTGLGAVGLGAIMAAKNKKCKAIIAVDVIDSRLEIAKEVGATHTINTSHLKPSSDTYADDLAAELKKVSPNSKINYAIDTTGFLPVVNGQIKALSKRGKLIQIGIPVPVPTNIIQFDFQDFFGGTKRMEVNYLGDFKAQDAIPKMVEWYRNGTFPFDRFVKMYPASEVKQAMEDMKAGVIKPILIH